MTGVRCRRGRTDALAAALTLTLALALYWTCLASAPTAAGSSPRRAEPAAPSIPTPMSTAVEAADGTWATLPMGRLDESLNTFWQLFYRPDRNARWSNKVEATATATNGGLVLTAGRGGSIVVGVRPSSYLTYTPLVSTSGPARTWASGLIDAELAARPDALAGSPGGAALALVGSHHDSKVLESGGNLSSWTTLTTERLLGSTRAGRTCGLGALTAVGSLGGRPLIGASCSRPGVVGLFTRAEGAWRLTGPPLPRSVSGGRAEVLSAQITSSESSVLLAVARGAETDLVAAWAGPDRRWTTSTPWRLAAGATVVSFGTAGAGELFTLVRTSSGRSALVVAHASTGRWRVLPPPPAATATVAFSPSSPVQALVAGATQLTVWSLDARTRRWVPGQVVHVRIQYGSSTQ